VIGSPPVSEPFNESTPGGAAVRGFLHRPSSAVRGGLVLTHGAGSNCTAPLLVALAEAFAVKGLAVLRCDLPYRQIRRTGPPHPAGAARDRAGLIRAATVLRQLFPKHVALGGQSYGGRQASMAAAEEPDVADALLLLSYPLHPPGRADQPRTGHFPQLRTPALFAHGSADPFGSLDELEAARLLIPARTLLIAIDGAGHGLGKSPKISRPAAETVERVVEGFLGFIEAAKTHP
jgi:predicted alpha/beta-hydrolase family hydrolase